MPYGTSQATSNDWLSADESVRFSTRNFVESMTLSISESLLNVGFRQAKLCERIDLPLELESWDMLSDEALSKFEDSL